MEENTNTYESQFTKDRILALKDAINSGINKHVETDLNGEKLDLFVIVAALQQSAYEVVMRSMPADNDDAKKAHEEMKQIANVAIVAIDKNRKELKTRSMAEILGSIHGTSIITEFYATSRDSYIKNLEKQADVMNGVSSEPTSLENAPEE